MGSFSRGSERGGRCARALRFPSPAPPPTTVATRGALPHAQLTDGRPAFPVSVSAAFSIRPLLWEGDGTDRSAVSRRSVSARPVFWCPRRSRQRGHPETSQRKVFFSGGRVIRRAEGQGLSVQHARGLAAARRGPGARAQAALRPAGARGGGRGGAPCPQLSEAGGASGRWQARRARARRAHGQGELPS